MRSDDSPAGHPVAPDPVVIVVGADVEAARRAVAAATPADVVLVGDVRELDPGVPGRLAAAAGPGAEIATVSALTRPGPIPERPGDMTVTRIARPSDGCVLVRRGALELAGDAGLIGSGGELGSGFADRCAAAGLAHLLAPGVVVDGPAHPVGGDRTSPAAVRTFAAARRGERRLRVAVDARMLRGRLDGTRTHALELIGAVAATGELDVTALIDPGIDAGARATLDARPAVSVVAVDPDGPLPPARFDLVHRPFQLTSPADLALLTALAPRLVVTHQDLISFHAPEHFADHADWIGYRALTREALAVADRVLTFSGHVRRELLGEDLAEPDRVTTVPIGVDHGGGGESARPAAVAADADVMLCLGTDYRHKNRLFALRVLDALQRRHDWPGRLVLAGGHAAHGSSHAEERRFLADHERVGGAVTELGPVAEEEKRWLLAHAGLVLFPSVDEGFGLVPFEAAAHDTPCLWAPAGALAELLGAGAAPIVAWDAEATADAAHRVLDDPAAAGALVATVRDAAAGLRWSTAGAALADVYAETCDGPPSPVGHAARSAGLLGGAISEDAMRLVGPDGVLPAGAERPLLALVSKPALARPAGALLRAGHRVARRAR